MDGGCVLDASRHYMPLHIHFQVLHIASITSSITSVPSLVLSICVTLCVCSTDIEYIKYINIERKG